MKWRPRLVVLVTVGWWGSGSGCSNLTETGGIAGLELRIPRPAVVEVDQTITLHAKALDARGDSIPAHILWLTPDASVTLTPDGQLTGKTGGASARVQAQAGSVVSDFVQFTVNYKADTLQLVGDSVLTVLTGTDVSAPLLASVRTINPPQGLSDRPLVYTITAPTFTSPAARTVELSGGVLALTAITGADGTPASSVTVNRVIGRPAPDSAIVVVSAATATGAAVPGSGQRFIIRFQ